MWSWDNLSANDRAELRDFLFNALASDGFRRHKPVYTKLLKCLALVAEHCWAADHVVFLKYVSREAAGCCGACFLRTNAYVVERHSSKTPDFARRCARSQVESMLVTSEHAAAGWDLLRTIVEELNGTDEMVCCGRLRGSVSPKSRP